MSNVASSRHDSCPEPSPPTVRRPPTAVPANPLWSRLVRGGSLQAKLQVGAVDDPLEREADRVADAVVSGSAAPAAVQRKCAACEEEEMHRSPAELPAEDEEEKLQTKRSSGATPEVSPKTASRIASFHGGGEALSPAARSYFEPRFGHDLSAVRLHTGGEAAAAASEVAARAFTVGRDIAFGAGEYRPETQEGKKLLAHELTHTLQQSASPGPGAGVVRRHTTKPPRRFDVTPLRPRRRLSDGAELILDDLHEIFTTVETSLSPYTRGTKKALRYAAILIYYRLRKLEKRKLSEEAKARLRTITAAFVKDLKDAVARPPEKDPNEEDNLTIEIVDIKQQWSRAFKDRLKTEYDLERVKKLKNQPLRPSGPWSGLPGPMIGPF